MSRRKHPFIKIVVTVPPSHAERVRRAIGKAGGGYIGKYDMCSFTLRGTGRFRGLKGARPFLGKTGRIEKVIEEHIEITAPKRLLAPIVIAIRNAHPYEEPAIDIYPLLYP